MIIVIIVFAVLLESHNNYEKTNWIFIFLKFYTIKVKLLDWIIIDSYHYHRRCLIFIWFNCGVFHHTCHGCHMERGSNAPNLRAEVSAWGSFKTAAYCAICKTYIRSIFTRTLDLLSGDIKSQNDSVKLFVTKSK